MLLLAASKSTDYQSSTALTVANNSESNSSAKCKVINIHLPYRGINPERFARGKGRRTLN